jgi:hypothetical protein
MYRVVAFKIEKNEKEDISKVKGRTFHFLQQKLGDRPLKGNGTRLRSLGS